MTTTAPPPRMAWLDALRGLAVLIVAWYHVSSTVLGYDHFLAVHRYLNLGKYGVLLFFLVSGYVVPMSLERHGSPRRFWTGRVFRIYPAFLATSALVVLLAALGWCALPDTAGDETATTVLGHATMLQEFLGVRGFVWPFWTLSFEMVFYLLVAGLFVLGRHRLSAWWAGGLALVGLFCGTALPDALFIGDPAARRTTAAVLVVAVGLSIAAYLSGRRRFVLPAAAAGLGFLLLPLLNGHGSKWTTSDASWEAVILLAVMFAGTVIHRLQYRQIGRTGGLTALALVLVAVALGPYAHTGRTADLLQWTVTALATAATFALAWLARHRRVPAAMTWLGSISYSIYLLHLAGLYVLVHFLSPSRTVPNRLFLVFSFAVLTLAAGWLMHRFVELPGQALGRHVQRYLDARLGPDHSRRTPPGPRTGTDSANAGTASVVMADASV